MYFEKEYQASYYLRNKKQIIERRLRYYEENKETIKLAKRSERDSEEFRSKRRSKYKTNFAYKMRCIIRGRITTALKRRYKTIRTMELLGCSLKELRVYLESKFLPGMTWENWTLKGWHIDHIRPLAQFDLSDPEQLKIAAHYTNLQPLWATDNLRKPRKTKA